MSTYSRWACAIWKPVDQPQAMHFTRQEIAAKLHEFKGLPVRLEHTEYLLGKVGDAHQAKQGSLFVRLDFRPASIEAQSAVDAIKRGDIRGVSVNHNPLTKQLHEISATKVPGREGCYLLPEATAAQLHQSDPTQACFSYFDSLEYNDQSPPSNTMEAPAEKPVEAARPADAKPAEAKVTETAKPTDKPVDAKSEDNELTVEKAEAIAKAARAIEEENKRIKAELEQLRKKTEPLEKERAEKVASFVSTLFQKVVRETPEQKTKADAAQRRLAEAVLADETLSELVLSTNKAVPPADPRDEQVRKSVKRSMGPETRSLLDMAREGNRDEKSGEFRHLRKSTLDPALQSILDSAFSLQAAAPQAAFSNTSEKDREITEKFTENYRQQSMTGAPPITFEPQHWASFQAYSNR